MKITKKSLFIGLILLFLLNNSSFLTSREINDINSDNFVKSIKNFREITFYRIDINGKISPIVIEIEIEKDKNKEIIIAEKCQELFNVDAELQMSINENKDEFQWIDVMSKGNGFHLSFRKIWITNRNVTFRTIIRYRYFFEFDYTKIRTEGSEQWRYLLNGSQKVQLKGFTGYIYFQPKGFWGNTIICGKTLGIDWATPRWPK